MHCSNIFIIKYSLKCSKTNPFNLILYLLHAAETRKISALQSCAVPANLDPENFEFTTGGFVFFLMPEHKKAIMHLMEILIGMAQNTLKWT